MIRYLGVTPSSQKCVLLFALITQLALNQAWAQTALNVATRNYNNQRTGANLSETILNQSNVNASQFGKLFALPVDDQVYAGVLYASAVSINGATHNVIYVATVNNSVYAFDADTLGPALWFRNFNGSGRPTVNTEVGQGCSSGYKDFIGNIGIVGTPVIDTAAGTIFFVTRTVEAGATVQRLRALDIATGADRANSPQVIQATVPGTGEGGTSVSFHATTQNQRPALAFSQGVVYIAWAAFCDTGPYHGWVMAYNSSSLSQVGVFNTTPNGSQGGIWMAGAAPASDASGNLFYSVGNGSYDGVSGFGEAMLKLAPGSLSRLDFFAPSNFNTLNAGDLDFGSSGPTMLPGTNLLVSGGKEGRLYLLDGTNLGKQVSGDVQIPQVFQAVSTTVRTGVSHHIHNNSPAWTSPQGLNVYVWGENDFLRAYRFDPTAKKLQTTPTAVGSILPPVGMPGGMMTISGRDSQPGSGIVWASAPRSGNANQAIVPGMLYAFNAENLALLWSSTAAGDDPLNFSKGSIPMVANGKVYLGSTSKVVTVYGPKTGTPPTQDLALFKPATGSTSCSTTETPDKTVNGSVTGGLSDKWCSKASPAQLTVDLGTSYSLNRFVISHAGAGGESTSFNTAAFSIQISTDGVNFTTVVNVTGNTQSITTHDITAANGRYVRLNVTTPTGNGDPAARIYEFVVNGSAATSSPDFSISAASSSPSVTAGASTNYTTTVSALNGFTGTVTLSAAGLPAGAVATFTPASITGSGVSTLNVSTTTATPAGTSTLIISGVSGALRHDASTSLTVVVPGGGTARPVNMSSAYSRVGMFSDGSVFSSTSGLDNSGSAYSANLLGTSQTIGGVPFTLGTANLNNAATSTTVTLPAGGFSSVKLLATGVKGNQGSQGFTVTYTDGTTSTFTQSLSDWFSPQHYAGETTAVTMAYRLSGNGTKDNRTFYLYGYSFALNAAKTVSSIRLPGNSSVVVLAITLVP